MNSIEEIKQSLNNQINDNTKLDHLELASEDWFKLLMSYEDSILSQYFRGGFFRYKNRFAYTFRGYPITCSDRHFFNPDVTPTFAREVA